MNLQTPYVYAYYRPSGEVPFYIGKGQGRRLRRHMVNARNPYVQNVVQKILMSGGKPEIRVLAYLHDHNEACRVEKALIAAYGRKVDGGPLVNVTDGGTGVGGWKWTPEQREVWRSKVVGQKRTLEQRKRIAEAVTGHKHSDATKEKLRAIVAQQWSDPAARLQRSENQRQRMADPLERAKISKALSGHKQSAETIEKRVGPWRGKARPKEYTEACRLAKIGKPRSQECKDKISATKRMNRQIVFNRLVEESDHGKHVRPGFLNSAPLLGNEHSKRI